GGSGKSGSGPDCSDNSHLSLQPLGLRTQLCAQLQPPGADNGDRPMNQNSKSFFRGIYQDQRGQMIPILAFMMISLLGCAGLVVDTGHAYFSYRLLQNSTNAAALAGAQGLPFNTSSTNQALANAKAYSSQAASKSQSAGYNAYGNLNITNAT